MQRLIDFIENKQLEKFEYGLPESVDTTALLDAIAESTRENFKRQFVREPHHHHGYRASMLGQNVWLQVWNKFYEQPKTMRNIGKRKLLEGLEFEEYLYMVMCQLGYYGNINRQTNLEYKLSDDIKITGHPDFIVTCPDTGTKTIIECKEVESKRYKSMLSSGMGLQYEVQLMLYMNITGYNGGWIISNRDTKEMAYIKCAVDQSMLAQAYLYTIHLHQLEKFEDAYAIFPVPKPTRHARSQTRYIPYYFYTNKGELHPIVDRLYTYESNEGKFTATGYNFPDAYKDYEPNDFR